MGRALHSAFIHDLLDTLQNLTFQTKPHRYLRKIKDKLLTLDGLVDDAQQIQFIEEANTQADAVNGWLNELVHVVYYLEEVLQQWEQITTTTTTAKSFLLQLRVLSITKTPDKDIKVQIRGILESLEALEKNKGVLGLTESTTWRESLQGLPSCSAVLNTYFHGKYPKDCIYGRDEEEMSILEILLSTTSAREEIKVINIVGEAGVGKTALADVLFFNHKVRESFGLRAWVTVPDKASSELVANKILEAVTENFVPDNDFDVLMKRLQDSFVRKKFLVVLDDIRIEDKLQNWSRLIISCFASATRGSAIILTSVPHDDPNLLEPPASHTVHLNLLSKENSWLIFLAHASGKMDLHDQQELATVGKKIVNKLRNLPLAAKMIGSLLKDKHEIEQWVKILSSRLLDAGDVNLRIASFRVPSKFLDAGDVNLHIPSFLVMCYLDLPAQIKRCFAYLSLFPKGYQFKLKEVVLLWMAEGFLKNSHFASIDKSMEDIGDEYFGYLIRRSFLQPYGSDGCFIMHNLVHDLATYVFGESYKHHFSYSRNTRDLGLSFLLRHGKSLRTFLPVTLPIEERTPRRFDMMLKMTMLNPKVLRVLSLSHYDITNLPDSIGILIHLSYLDLSYTALHKLPDSICDLLNLQTLLLTNCTSLTSLPQRICNLIKLRYLDLRGSDVQEMPLEMHRLTSLQTLTSFIVSKSGPSLGDLAELSNLKTLTISKLQNVAYAEDASDAKLIKKKSLDDLMLQWGNGNNSNMNEVLENLEPHKDLKSLTVDHYSGERFPNWFGDPSYQALQKIALRHCENCYSLPTLGLLPFLKDLVIQGFTKVSSVGLEFYGVMSSSQKPFQSLECLQFRDMLEWKEWNTFAGDEFPHLVELHIIRCPKLVRHLPKQLLSLKKLEIFGCYNLVAPRPEVSGTCKVFVHKSYGSLIRKNHLLASVGHWVTSPESQEFNAESYSEFASTSSEFHTSEIEEISQEARVETESTRSKLPPDSPSSDTTRITKLKTISSGILSHQVEADIPYIRQQTDPHSPMAEDDIPITNHVVVLPLADTPKTKAPVQVETSSEEYLDDQRSSFEILKISAVSQLKSLPSKLHTLKIDGCESLEVLPDDLLRGITTLKELYLISCSSLTSLPYLGSFTTLYIHNCRKLEFLPSSESSKKLSSLHHLFIGSSCDSLETLTLNLFLQLKILCIWDCPNLRSFNVTPEFRGNLASLESLEIRDCPRLRSFPDDGLPTPNLASIFLCNCKILNKLPNAMNSLTSLNSLFLHRCPQIEYLPLGGLPLSLTLISIAYCDKLRPQKDWGLNTLESLNHFELEGGCIGMESFPDEKLLPSDLNSLRISKLESLKKLDYKGFQQLNALRTLEIHCCEILRSLPDEGLPSSLNQLCIHECPLLTPRLTKQQPKTKGKEWHKVARIPHVQIDHHQVLC